MADITPVKSNILNEEADYRSALSESFFNKLGGSINFINDKQSSVHMFTYLGPFKTGEGNDGGIVFTNDCSIVAVSGYIRDSGSSGSTVVDIHRVTSAGDQGTILSTKLTIPSTVTAVPWGKNFVYVTEQASGTTLPVASTTDFNAFDFLRIDIDSVAVAARDLIINLWYRPR